MREIKTVALIGLGAIGGFLAERLGQALGDGLRVVADGPRGERIRQNGLLVNGRRVDFHVVSPEEKTGCADAAILIPKMTGLEQALLQMKNQIGPDTIILTPLNGVDSEEAAAKVYGGERVLYSLVRASVVRRDNAISFDPSLAFIEFGERINPPVHSERVQALEALFARAGVKYIVQPDMEKAIWEKFVCNVSENQISAVLGIPFGAWGKSAHANALRVMVADEVIAVARKKGILIDLDYAERHLEYLRRVPAGNKASTLQDIEQGRKTEVEMFAGTMMRLGREQGVPTPCNDLLYHAIRVLEEKNDGLI